MSAPSPPAASAAAEPSSARAAAAPVPLRSLRSVPGRCRDAGGPGRPEPSGEPRRAAAGRPRSSRLCLVSGIRTEQDFYVRLIDSMTKQVGAAGRPPSRGVAAVGAAPGGESRPRSGAALPGGEGTGPPPPAGTAALPLRAPTGLRGGEGGPRGTLPAAGLREKNTGDPPAVPFRAADGFAA